MCLYVSLFSYGPMHLRQKICMYVCNGPAFRLQTVLKSTQVNSVTACRYILELKSNNNSIKSVLTTQDTASARTVIQQHLELG